MTSPRAIPAPPRNSVHKKIRVRKEDAAFLYFTLEAHEGIASYTTLEGPPGAAYRDIELRIPPDFVSEVESLLKSLGDQVHEL